LDEKELQWSVTLALLGLVYGLNQAKFEAVGVTIAHRIPRPNVDTWRVWLKRGEKWAKNDDQSLYFCALSVLWIDLRL